MLQMRRFNMGAVGEADCPVFDGLFDYCAVRADPWADRFAPVPAGRLLSLSNPDAWALWA